MTEPPLTSSPVQSLHGTGLSQPDPGPPVLHQTTHSSHLWGNGRGFKYFLLEPGQGHTAFGGSPNHAHKRCNNYPRPANIGTKHLILWALLQHARWTWTFPLSFIFTDTTVSLGQTLPKHKLLPSESSLTEITISCFEPITDLPLSSCSWFFDL